jgi:hypothetical protein
MGTYYVIQVWAYHGVGTQGWRMVNQRAGEPFRFRTREEAEAAMRQHFGNLRAGVSVRVHEVAEEPPEPTAKSAPSHRRPPVNPSS